MKANYKILNDPVYGFTNLPFGILYDLTDHPYFQRLRRIKQVGLSHYVYPGAVHTRFQHALGALHLTRKAVDVLNSKSVTITQEEATALQIAILLHDIGHGPYSHALEEQFLPFDHEAITLAYMQELNKTFNGQLEMAIAIFTDQYPKKFLHELVSSQLDMDRVDYLIRDSYYTGVAEGIIGYDRIIKMLDVHEGQLVVEEKGIYSVEKFLMSRKIMYWQVYLHKAVLSAEQMLVRLFKYYKEQYEEPQGLLSLPMQHFLHPESPLELNTHNLQLYALLDDTDVDCWVKSLLSHEDPVLKTLAEGLTHRKLFRIWHQKEPFQEAAIQKIYQRLHREFGLPEEILPQIVIQGSETNRMYNQDSPEIKILRKSGEVQPLSLEMETGLDTRLLKRYFICHPKFF